MSKIQLIKQVAKATKVSQKETAEVIDTFIASIEKEVAKGKTVSLKGFGQFYTITRDARKGRNPKTGKPIDVPATTLTKFSAGRAFKTLVKGKAAKAVAIAATTAAPAVTK